APAPARAPAMRFEEGTHDFAAPACGEAERWRNGGLRFSRAKAPSSGAPRPIGRATSRVGPGHRPKCCAMYRTDVNDQKLSAHCLESRRPTNPALSRRDWPKRHLVPTGAPCSLPGGPVIQDWRPPQFVEKTREKLFHEED